MKKLFVLSLFVASAANGASGLGGTPLSPAPMSSNAIVNALGFVPATSTNEIAGNLFLGPTNYVVSSIGAAQGAPLNTLVDYYSRKPCHYYNSFFDATTYLGGNCNMTLARLTNTVLCYKTNGMLAAGYDLISIDDGMWETTRDSTGALVPLASMWTAMSLSNFIYYAHTNGFKVGVYVALTGPTTSCNTPGYGSVNTTYNVNWQQMVADAYNFATWQVDFVKLDYGSGSIINPSTYYQWRNSGIVDQTRDFVDSILQMGRPMRTILNEPAYSSSYSFPRSYLNASWIVNSLISAGGFGGTDIWQVQRNFTNDLSFVFQTKPGHNLTVTDIGSTSASDTNALKANLSALYALSEDTQIYEGVTITANMLKYLTNVSALSIGDDAAWIPATNCLWGDTTTKVSAWLKPLGQINGISNAIYFFNGSNNVCNFTIADTNMNYPAGSIFTVYDCWAQADVGVYTNTFTYTLSASNTALFRVIQGTWQTSTNLISPNQIQNTRFVSGGFPIVYQTNGIVSSGANAQLGVEERAVPGNVYQFYGASTGGGTAGTGRSLTIYSPLDGQSLAIFDGFAGGEDYFNSGISAAGFASTKNNKAAPTSITVTASVFNYTNTTSWNIQVFLDANGANTAVTFNGTAIFSALVGGDHTIIMQPGDRIGVTYSVATPLMRYREF